MSAFLCTEEHMYEMAHYFVANCQKYMQPEHKLEVLEVVKILWEANIDSLVHRYGEDEKYPLPPMKVLSHYHPIVANIHHMAALVDCYTYQSCEPDNWEETKAFGFCVKITYALLFNHEDYEEAPWGFERDEYIEKFIDN